MLVLLSTLSALTAAWTVARPASPVSAAQHTPTVEFGDRAAGFAPGAVAVVNGPVPVQVAAPLFAQRQWTGSFVALCTLGALLGYGYGKTRQEATLAVLGKRATGTPGVQRTGLGDPLMQLQQYGYNNGRRDAAARLQNRSYETSLGRNAYGSGRGYSRYNWKRNAPQIFMEGLENLARDPLGWLDADRPSYLRGNGYLQRSQYQQQRYQRSRSLPAGRSLGDGVVSRTYGKRNLYETDAERANRYRGDTSYQGRGVQNESYLNNVNRPGVFEGPGRSRRDYYFERDRPGVFEGPTNWSSNPRFNRNETARRAINENQWQAIEREQSVVDWKTSAQGPQSSIRQSEAHNAYRYGGRNASDRAAYRNQRSLSAGRSHYDPVEDAVREQSSWARNAQARDAARRANYYDSGFSGRVVPSRDYNDSYNDSYSDSYASSYNEPGW